MAERHGGRSGGGRGGLELRALEGQGLREGDEL